MSSDFAFSETTPLRQSDCSNAISSTTAIAIANSRNSNNITCDSDSNGIRNGNNTNTNSNPYNRRNNNNNINNNNNNNNNNNINNNNNNNNNLINSANNITTSGSAIGNEIPTPTTTTTIGTTVQLETGLNSNRNGFTNRILRRNLNNNNKDKMDTNRKLVRKIAMDFVLLLCVGLPILCFFLFVEPYKRGFFCDDESLKHPFHDSTVKNYMLYIIGLVLPLCIIVPMEYFHGKNKSMPTYRFMDFDLPSWIVESYKQVGIFAFGAGSQQLVVDIAKYSVGRLRPHFIDVCQPIMPDGTRCDDPINLGRYIEDFTCEAHNSTPRMIKDMRLSFPSGHASFSAFTMIYCIIYLQARMNWRGSKLLKHFLQLLLFSITWFTALSRISDYKHHWSDVLAGGVIGIVFALVVSQCVADFRDTVLQLPRTQHDITANNINTTSSRQQHHNNTNHQQQNNHQNSGQNGHNNYT
ncbi:putative phosphatidate phosphatase isoform X2 [Condylostylus longicornis]|uniref:putative phosphatidate phosphatase isoform X2 n=1 Tax=Condylostylus longicornis TaxID=2530218 RepID=UPI00244E51E0|nr:putative phosphatidate phosphatase isoform X2 [Condylostylus longicornis]